MGPLALMAKAAGFEVSGSDLSKGNVYDELINAGIDVHIGPQDGQFLQSKINQGLDWFVYTSALPPDHAELRLAHAASLKCTKRDDFTAYLVEKLHLKMVAVAGTHGKTTTTAMLIWGAHQLHLPAAYIVGTTLPWAPAGSYHPGDQFFIYEADEYDRNFLKYHPWLAVIPAVGYDHADIYPTPKDYLAAFDQFRSQCEQVIDSSQIVDIPPSLQLAGSVRRLDTTLALMVLQKMAPDIPSDKIIDILNQFPGAGRRFERLADGFYTDYAHHPDEIAATLDIAKDEAHLKGYKGISVIYQPHQNTRQHQVRHQYKNAFTGATKLYWLSTYLTREDPSHPVLTPAELIAELTNPGIATPAELDDALWANIQADRQAGNLILLLTAGPADTWLRQKVQN